MQWLILFAGLLAGVISNVNQVHGQGIVKCPGECDWNPCGCCEPNMVNFCSYCDRNGCDQCDGVNTIFKRNNQYFCENCTDIFGSACLFCQDFVGCGHCEQGYNRIVDGISGLYYCEDPINPYPVKDCGATGDVGEDWPIGEDPSCVDPTPKPTPEPTPQPTPYTEVLATSNTCFNAADGDEALNYKFSAPFNGIISGIRLKHNYGGTTCIRSRPLTNWGCITTSGERFWTNLVKIADDETSVSNGNTLYPTYDTNNIQVYGSCGETPQYIYQLSDYGINSDEFIFYSSTTSYDVSTLDTFVLGASEAVCDLYTHDNSGTSCAQVYFLYSEIFR